MKPYRILAIDDEPDILKLVRISLEMSNFSVIEAANGIKALEFLNDPSQELPNLILLDIMMPDMNGYEVCKTIKSNSRTKDIPVVMLTAKGQQGDAEMGLRLGADDYIVKPFDPYELTAQLISLLRGKKIS
jgi:two-component system phosphate regulon response regulator PhoB